MPVHLVRQLQDTCEECGAGVWYSEARLNDDEVGYDLIFCKACDRWLEEACDNPACVFCPGRPPRPSGVAYEERTE